MFSIAIEVSDCSSSSTSTAGWIAKAQDGAQVHRLRDALDPDPEIAPHGLGFAHWCLPAALMRGKLGQHGA
jgi:hypothetical protein